MKISIFEKAKLLYQLNQDENRVNIVLKFRKNLTDYGFELYVKYFFEKVQGYKTTFETKTRQKDDGIDIKGIKGKKGEEEYTIIQCKKWSTNIRRKITKADIASFYGLIASKINKFPNTKIYFITTSSEITKDRVFFAEENNIIIKDYKNILKMNKIYSFERFKEDIQKENINLEKVFNYEQLSLINLIEKEQKESSYMINKETESFLKIVRESIAKEKQMFIYEIASNETIEIIARNRPSNLEALKKVIEKERIDFREQKKLERYGKDFINSINLLNLVYV